MKEGKGKGECGVSAHAIACAPPAFCGDFFAAGASIQSIRKQAKQVDLLIPSPFFCLFCHSPIRSLSASVLHDSTNPTTNNIPTLPPLPFSLRFPLNPSHNSADPSLPKFYFHAGALLFCCRDCVTAYVFAAHAAVLPSSPARISPLLCSEAPVPTQLQHVSQRYAITQAATPSPLHRHSVNSTPGESRKAVVVSSIRSNMATSAAAISLLHSHASHVGFHHHHHRNVGLGSARNALLRTTVMGGSMRCSSSAKFNSSSSSRPSCTRRNSSMSFNNGSMAENFSENDEDYADCSIVEAQEVKSGPDGFVIKMRDGNVLKCVHNKTERGKLPVYAPQPAIVLQLNDGSNLLLPIIVLELPNVMLLEAVRNVQVARPTVYQVMSKMLEVSGYRAKVVRVTKRVNEAYLARIYLVKDGDDTAAAPVSLDVRPSDAINFAVRCKIPIQVNKDLAVGDGVRIVSEPEKLPSSVVRNGQVITDMDRPLPGDCEDAKEFILIRDMYIAAVEERFIDAARIRDALLKFRKTKQQQKLM